MPPLATPRRHSARDQLVEAAAQCFAARGFHATPTAEITAAAGVSTGLLFHHFGSKKGLLLAIVAAEAKEIGEVGVPRSAAAARATLNTILSEACAQADDPVHGPLALEIARVAHHDPEVAACVRLSDDALRDVTGRLAVAGGSGLPAATAGTWIAAVIDGVFSRVATQPDFSAVEHECELRALVSGFLGWVS